MAFVARTETLARVLAAVDSTPFFWIDDPWNGILLAKSGVRIHDIGGEHVCAAECWSGLVQRSLWFQHLPGASYRRNMPRLWAKMAHGTRA